MFKSFAVRVFAVLILVALVPVLGITWGNEGHQAINRVAAQKLPADMPAFLKNSADHLGYLGPQARSLAREVEPQLKYSQEPDHFMDMELTDWMGKLPADRYSVTRAVYDAPRCGPKNACRRCIRRRSDSCPTRHSKSMVVSRSLSANIVRRRKRAARRLTPKLTDLLAGWLGHYVGDGSNPLHTTVQYNGWTGPNPNKYDTGRRSIGAWRAHSLAAPGETGFLRAW